MKESPETLIPEYFKIHSTALLRLQFVEESLRMYLSLCYDIIRNRTKGLILFGYTYSDLQKRTMRVLAEEFKHTNGNCQLIKDIIQIVKSRNRCAHTALLMTSDEMHDIKYVKKEIKKINDIAEKAQKCFHGLLGEIKSLEEVASRENLL